jgi:hypothetical protein
MKTEEQQATSAVPAQQQEGAPKEQGSKFFDPAFWDESSEAALAKQDANIGKGADKYRWLIVRHSKFPLKGGDPLNGGK